MVLWRARIELFSQIPLYIIVMAYFIELDWPVLTFAAGHSLFLLILSNAANMCKGRITGVLTGTTLKQQQSSLLLIGLVFRWNGP